MNFERVGLITSFGKMVLSKNDTRPQYTFAQTKRQALTKEKTDYLYKPTPEHNYKYYKVTINLIDNKLLLESRMGIWYISKEQSILKGKIRLLSSAL